MALRSGPAPRLAHLAGAFVVLAAAAWAFVRWHHQPVVFDDSFISFRYAYNFVHGRGLVYNAGERVEGYTNFAWVLIAAAALREGRDPLAITRAVGVASYVVSVALVVGVALAPPRRSFVPRVVGVALACLLVLPPGVAPFAGTGLETPFVGLLVLAMGLVHHLFPSSRPGWRLLAAIVPLVALLTRLDTALAVAASAIALIEPRDLPPARRVRAIALEFGLTFGPAAIGLAVYLAWKRSYYGAILPNTYYAKAADGWHADAGATYVMAFVQSCPASVVLVLFAISGLVLAKPGPRSRFLRYGVVASVLHVAYAIKIGGDFMEYRFMWELWPLLVCSAVVGAAEIVSHARSVAVVGACLALLVAPTPAVLEKQYGMQSIPQMNEYAELGERVGSSLATALPRDTLVATTLAGMAYFMPDVATIDQWGLNDRFVAHMPLARFIEVEGFNARGHLKYAPESYLRQRNVNLLIGHPTVCDCDHLCRDGKPSVYVRIGSTNSCLRTAYLTQTRELTDSFCQRPDAFVLDRVECPIRAKADADKAPR
jgi:arabinofuranosyltransferase